MMPDQLAAAPRPLSPGVTRDLVLELARTPTTWAEALAIADLMFHRSTTENLVDLGLTEFGYGLAVTEVFQERQWWFGVWSVLLHVEGGARSGRLHRAAARANRALRRAELPDALRPRGRR